MSKGWPHKLTPAKTAICLAVLNLLALQLSGCWNWSFPEELLGDRGVSLDTIGTIDTIGTNDTIPAIDQEIPLDRDDGLSCTACSGTSPICDGNSCRSCQRHEECGGGLCLPDGSCPAELDIAYVAAPPACDTGPQDGSRLGPYCTINDAAAQTARTYILVQQGSYDQTTISNDHEVYGVDYDLDGEQAALLLSSSNDCRALVINAGAAVRIAGFKIGVGPEPSANGGVSVEGEGTSATLEHNIIGPSQCVGVTGGKDTAIELRRNLIDGNAMGGISLLDVTSYIVINNFITKNGALTTPLGGAHLKAKDEPALFINNTVVGNQAAKGKEGGLSGVNCEGISTVVLNSIIWDNTTNDDNDPLKDQHKSCELNFCNARDAVGFGDLAVDPLFKGNGDYHLQFNSPLKNKGIKWPNTPAIDFDGDPRDTTPDIGADEII